MKIPIFPGKYHQNGGFSMAMLVYRSVGPGGSRTAIFWDDDGWKTRWQLSPQIFAVHHRTRFANKISELGIVKYLHLTKHAQNGSKAQNCL